MSSIEFPPHCGAVRPAPDPGEPLQECTKPIDHGGRWHGNEDAFWPIEKQGAGDA